MRFAIHNPRFLFCDGHRDFTGYRRAFFEQHNPVLYFPGWRNWLTLGKGVSKLLQHSLGHDQAKVVVSLSELNREADILLSFNDFPYEPHNRPPRGFHGMKVWHLMDYVFSPERSLDALRSGKVDILMGYTNHFSHCAFYRHFFRDWNERILAVPFGFGERFHVESIWSNRKMQVVAMGSVNPVDDPAVGKNVDLSSYKRFYRNERWTHAWRRSLKEHESQLAGIMHSLLPDFPATKNLQYDPVKVLNGYAMFANDEGLMAFPPARTYEGPACGCLMVAADHPCYRDLGFVDGENCLLHAPMDIADFERKTKTAFENPEWVESLALAGCQMVRNRYSHSAVAETLSNQLERQWRAQA